MARHGFNLRGRWGWKGSSRFGWRRRIGNRIWFQRKKDRFGFQRNYAGGQPYGNPAWRRVLKFRRGAPVRSVMRYDHDPPIRHEMAVANAAAAGAAAGVARSVSVVAPSEEAPVRRAMHRRFGNPKSLAGRRPADTVFSGPKARKGVLYTPFSTLPAYQTAGFRSYRKAWRWDHDE